MNILQKIKSKLFGKYYTVRIIKHGHVYSASSMELLHVKSRIRQLHNGEVFTVYKTGPLSLPEREIASGVARRDSNAIYTYQPLTWYKKLRGYED